MASWYDGAGFPCPWCSWFLAARVMACVHRVARLCCPPHTKSERASERADERESLLANVETNLQAMLQCGDERLVHAYRNYEFHRDDAIFIEELEDLRRTTNKQNVRGRRDAMSRLL
jgi:hypothetical protein